MSSPRSCDPHAAPVTRAPADTGALIPQPPPQARPASAQDEPAPSDTKTRALTSRTKKRRRKGRALLLVRRTHLYSGLALLPWVVLYGFSAMLFNHPGWMSDREVSTLGPELFEGTAFADIVEPEGLANDVIAAVGASLADRAQGAADGEGEAPPGPPSLGAIGNARFSGSFFYRSSLDGRRDSVIVNSSGEAARFYTTATDADAEPESKMETEDAIDPFASVGKLGLDAVDNDVLIADLPDILTRAGHGAGEISVRSMPTLRFDFTVDGDPWKGQYDLRRDTFSAEIDADNFGQQEARSLMLRLHTAHGYSATHDVRWLWAAFVDVMGVAMLFWGFSGIIMWWQIRRTRHVGYALFAITAVIATRLALAMATSLNF